VISTGARVVGIDLAWSPRNPSGIAVGTVTPAEVEIQTTALAETLDDIVALVSDYSSPGLTVAIDAPTVVPHEDRMRDCERLLHQDASIRTAHCAPYPGTRALLGKYNAGRPRGEELVALLRSRLGVSEVGCPPAFHDGRYAMEVFPAAAMVRLFGLTSPLVYKKKRGRTWDQCRFGLMDYIDRLQGLQNPTFTWPGRPAVTDEIGKRYKGLEDRVDAAFCAYLAALAWLGMADVVGDVGAGYIMLPAVVREPLPADPVMGRHSERMRDRPA
jgi:predicted RNase H-like nuclease